VYNGRKMVVVTCICLQNSLKDELNYGLYLPESNGRSGKFLDEERPLQDYPLSVPVALLEVCVVEFHLLNVICLHAFCLV